MKSQYGKGARHSRGLIQAASYCLAVTRLIRSVTASTIVATLLWTGGPSSAIACGGFFCQNTPIDQAGEQIVFRQEGSTITAMVRILYTGAAEEFSWVVPVPNAPELSVGSDTTFNELDFQTRPQFNLTRLGQECAFAGDTGGAGGIDNTASLESEADGSAVQVEDVVVGPYDAQIVSSDDPSELATWLTDNGYDLTDRGEELITPYVEAGMKFVALKMRNGQTAGSIQPLIMQYQSEKPMVPIRLTAVAAQDDMGVLVWVVGDARAVPENYAHVIPNYTRLNWYAGTFNAYASYQSLITEAMNEAGGQGFATDFAGAIGGGISASLTRGDALQQNLEQLDGISNNAEYIMQLVFSSQPSEAMLVFLESQLPLPGGFDNSVFTDQFAMTAAFTAQQLAEARVAARQFFVESMIAPIDNGVALLPDGAYMTRLYTTLSAEEMTLDPVFAYNTAMPDQAVTRNATLESRCEETGTAWTLTLGEGTGRDGEVVIDAGSDVPFQAPPEVNTQRSVFQIQETSADAAPVVTTSNTFSPLLVGSTATNASSDDDDGFLGLGSISPLALLLVLLGGVVRKSRLRRVRN